MCLSTHSKLGVAMVEAIEASKHVFVKTQVSDP